MTLNTLLITQPVPDIAQGIEIEMINDEEWVADEFAGIMIASGFGDRVIVTTLRPRPVDDHNKPTGRRRWTAPRSSGATSHTAARVRSPPS